MIIIIRPPTEADIDEIYAISCAVHLGNEYRQMIPPEQYNDFKLRFTPNDEYYHSIYQPRHLSRLADPDWYYFVAEIDGQVRGFTFAQQTKKAIELKGLFVDEAFQGRGIGKKLFLASCNVAVSKQPISLEVIAKNNRAVTIYEKAGFTRTNASIKTFFGAPMIEMIRY